jgi:hypothetical protein
MAKTPLLSSSLLSGKRLVQFTEAKVKAALRFRESRFCFHTISVQNRVNLNLFSLPPWRLPGKPTALEPCANCFSETPIKPAQPYIEQLNRQRTPLELYHNIGFIGAAIGKAAWGGTT